MKFFSQISRIIEFVSQLEFGRGIWFEEDSNCIYSVGG